MDKTKTASATSGKVEKVHGEIARDMYFFLPIFQTTVSVFDELDPVAPFLVRLFAISGRAPGSIYPTPTEIYC